MAPFKGFDFSKVRQSIVVATRLLQLFWKVSKGTFIGNLIVFAIPAVVPFVNAFIYALIIDLIVSSITSATTFNYQQLVILLILRFITLLIQDASFSIQTYFEQQLYYKFPAYLYQIVLKKISSLDLQYFEDSAFKDRLEKVGDSYTWRPLNMLTYAFYVYQSLLQTLIALVALVTLNWLFIFIIILMTIPSFLTQTKYANIEWGIWYGNSPKRKKFSYIAGLLQDEFSIKEIKLFQMAPRFLKELKFLYGEFTAENVKTGKKLLRINLILNLLSVILYVGLEIYIIFLAIARYITVGSVSYYIQVINNFQSGIGGLFRNSTQLFSQTLYVKEVFELLDTPGIIMETEKRVLLSADESLEIKLENISFTYPKSKEKIFDNFSLTVRPGEKIALVGENGAGKTTLIKLLARFYDVDEGKITINGVDIKDIDLASWYKCLGVLFQDFVRYEYSLEDNIQFGKVWEEKNDEKIARAAHLSGAAGVAQSLSKGYKQLLGKTFEDGAELSVGQWQKVALARAFLRDAPILILDEPTASIDAKAEAEIFEKVDNLSAKKTVIIISHRFSTVRNADKIYVIEKGKIKEEGSHEELLEQDKIYAKLFKLQAKGYQ